LGLVGGGGDRAVGHVDAAAADRERVRAAVVDDGERPGPGSRVGARGEPGADGAEEVALGAPAGERPPPPAARGGWRRAVALARARGRLVVDAAAGGGPSRRGRQDGQRRDAEEDELTTAGR